MKLLVTGASGQLGRELVRLIPGHDLLALDHNDLDITDSDAVREMVAHFQPDVVINAAAYTAVDKAEDDRDVAFVTNRDGPENLARVCESSGITLIHVSTDYVFDGTKPAPYCEDDPISPLGIYGESKAAGEAAVRKACSRHIILRTSWVFSAHGNNFVKTMLRLASEHEELRVVADQHGCPTSVADIAATILHICKRQNGQWGTYHFCQPEPTTWHKFAEAIVRCARDSGYDVATRNIIPITTDDYPTPAERPANSVLDCTKIEQAFGLQRRSWQVSLAEVIGEMKHG